MTDEIVIFQPMGRRVPLEKPSSLLELANRCGVPLEAACGGKGQCGKCKVLVNGEASPPTAEELDLLGPDAAPGDRLACQALVEGSARVWVPEASRLRKQKILTAGHEYKMEYLPAVSSYELEVPPASLDAATSDLERVLNQLNGTVETDQPRSWNTPLSVLRDLDEKLGRESGRVSVVAATSGRILDISPGWGKNCLGLAVDLGTTTIVAYLVDLLSGRVLSVKADMNPQVSLGEDVISRISLCQNHPEQLKVLGGHARECISRLAREACREAGVDVTRIFECVVVGNTAMHHILLGLNPCPLAHAPYAPVASDTLEVPAREVGLELSPNARVILLPVVAGFVGADTVAVALALDADQVSEPTLIVDLGTNAEIILATPDEIVCCSAAAGPAFEGGHTQWGMRAASGAIDRVDISTSDIAATFSVIGGGPPLGICGSGLVSLVSGLVNAGAILNTGGFDAAYLGPFLREGPNGLEYLVAPSDRTGTGRDLVLTHRDLAQLQLAKAAIHAGISLMMTRLGVNNVSRVLLAGAFGNYLDPQAACGINLFPGFDPDRVTGAGNAAGVGAMMALTSEAQRIRAQTMARRMHYLELAAHPEFTNAFVDGMVFM